MSIRECENPGMTHYVGDACPGGHEADDPGEQLPPLLTGEDGPRLVDEDAAVAPLTAQSER